MEKAIKNKVAKAVVPAIDVMFQALRFGLWNRVAKSILAVSDLLLSVSYNYINYLPQYIFQHF